MRRLLTVLVTGTALAAFVPAPALAYPGTWGPDGIPFSNGVLCDFGARTAALVSWPNTAGSTPAFALRTITGPSAGQTGATDLPASAGTATPYDPGAHGSSDGAAAALAYLITHSGTAGSGTTVGEVAALVAHDQDAANCVASGTADLNAADAQALSDRAAQLAGPYTVTVSKPSGLVVLGSASTVTARVTSAAGQPVPGLSVRFGSADGRLSASAAFTDANGSASTQVTVPSTATATTVTVQAAFSAATSLIELDQAGAVPLITSAPPQDFTGQTSLAIDTTASPVLQVSGSPGLVLQDGGKVTASVAVSGMRGHAGTGTLKALGPLKFVRGKGCTTYGEKDFAGAHASSLTDDAQVVGDHAYTVSIGSIHDPGCYLLTATIATTNAVPAATAESAPTAAAVVTVAPVRVAVTADHGGVALPGSLTATVRTSGDTPATVADAAGTLVGPVTAHLGQCRASMLSSAASAGSLTATPSDAASGVVLASGRVTDDGCYGLRASARVDITGVGTVDVPTLATSTVLVLDPSLEVTTLGAPSVQVGRPVHARVAVFGTLTQPAKLQLKLARLPDDAAGCFGSDYRSLDELPLPVSAPVTRGHGDDTYAVTSPPVPSQGCWTVEPVLTLDAVPNAPVTGRPVVGSNVAFTALDPTNARDIGGTAKSTSDSSRLLATIVIALIALAAALVATIVLARRSSSGPLGPLAAPGTADLMDGGTPTG